MYAGWRTWWPAPVREALPLYREFTLLCLLLSAWLRPVRHSWCTVYLNTSSTSLSSHMPVCAGLVVWGMLDGATRGRCLIVLWGRERCQRTGYTAVMVAVVCMPGFGLWGIDDAHYIFWTLRRRLSSVSHACQRWTWLFGACWTALHVVGVSLFCEAGSAVSGLVTRQLWWPWVACLATAWEAFECVHYIFELLCLQCMDIGIDGQWYGVRHFGFRGPVSLGAWSTWRGPWAAGRPEWRVNAGCVDVYIRELDARGA